MHARDLTRFVPFALAILPSAVLLSALLVAPLPAQTQAEPAAPYDPGTGPAAAGIQRPEGSEKAELREKTIYVPYTRLRQVFEKDGRGVFLPYDQFQQLWSQARQALVPEVEQKPPVKAFITEVSSVATVGPDVVTVRATLFLELLTEGWHEIPLRLADSAILDATLEDRPARIVDRGAAGYVLLLQKEGEQPEQRRLALRYAKAIQKSPGRNQVSFQAPQAPVNRWEFRIPEPGVKVNVHPLIAAASVDLDAAAGDAQDRNEPPPSGNNAETSPEEQPGEQPEDPPGEQPGEQPEDPPGEQPEDTGEETQPNPADADSPDPSGAEAADDAADGDAASEETRLQAFVGAAPEVRFDWTPKSEGATGLEALTDVRAEQQVEISEGVVRTTARLTYQISRAELSRLRIELPLDHKLTGVFDPNVRQWSVEAGENNQAVTVQFFQPARGTQQLALELERFTSEGSGNEVQVPVIRALDVARQQGIVAVRVSPALRAEVLRQEGLLQLDAGELPPALRAATPQFAYRYSTIPFDLALQVDKVEPRISTRELVEVYLQPRQLSVELLALFHVERAGVFQLTFDVPAEYVVLSVTSQAVAGHQAVAVDDFHRTGAEGNRLEVNLAGKALGKVALHLQLQRTLDDPNLLRPTGEDATIEMVPPRVSPEGLEQVDATMIVHAPESLQVTPAEEVALRGIPFEESLRETQSMRGGRHADLRPLLAYAASREPARLVLSVQRRKPYVTARQLLRARIESGVIQYRSEFFYHIRYSSVPSLRIDIPQELAAKIRNVTPGVREAVIEPAPEDLPEGMVAWNLSGDDELLGEFRVTLTWEEAIDELDVGGSLDVRLPRLEPRGVDRAWGQIVLEKAENLDLRPAEEPQGLRPIDPQTDLMPGVDGGNAARAFEFHDDWSLNVRITRYQLEEVKRTSIERGLVRIVVTRDVPERPGQTLVQALYRVRSVRQRLAITLPDGARFDANPLRINGSAVQLERGDQDEFFIPLADRNLDEAFLLELRYTAPGGYDQLRVAEFPEDPAVQKVFLCAYLPDELVVIGSEGPWTSEIMLQLREMLAGIPAVRHSDEQLLDWVREGFDTSGSPEFATDGNLYVFSTLRPPADAALRLSAMRRVVLNGFILAVIVGLGVALLARPLGERLMFLVALLAALIASAVFLPTLTVQLLNIVLASSVVLVLALWLTVSLIRTVPRLAQGLAPVATRARRSERSGPADSATEAAGEEDVGDDEQRSSGESPFASAEDPAGKRSTGEPPREERESTGGGNAEDASQTRESDEQQGGPSHA